MNGGDPADAMFVLLEGQLQARGEFAGETMTITVTTGQVTGQLPFSRMKTFTFSGARALTDCHILRFPESKFPDSRAKNARAYRAPRRHDDRSRARNDAARAAARPPRRARKTFRGPRPRGKANNPASAAKRASSQLRDILQKIRDAAHELGRRDLAPTQKAEIEKPGGLSIGPQKETPMDTLAISDLEEQLDSLLRSRRAENDLWQLAAERKAHRNIKPEVCWSRSSPSSIPARPALALVRIAAVAEVYGLLDEIESSASRISDLVLAIKEYTYMDQALACKNVDDCEEPGKLTLTISESGWAAE